MKACKIILLTVFLLFCQSVFAQTVNSSVTIKINGDRYIVSGIVWSDAVRNEIIESVKGQIGGSVEFSGIQVQTNAKPFQEDWQTNFDKSISKIKTWKSGVFIFGDNQTQSRPDYPPLPQEIANAQILLIDGQTVSLKDYKNKIVVLFLFAPWAYPAVKQAEALNTFYSTLSSRNIEILALDTDYSPDVDYEANQSLRRFLQRNKFRFTYGWANDDLKQYFLELSKLEGIPQAIVTFNGRLYGVFAGGGQTVEKRLEETIIKILDENNL